ncbi:hypothetical protein [Radiobacillus sp. PE A8.2]|uniref:hypothetical protein n=1 Tax=Radiobacillus sp. PE A8.2 TaxID=3380349 RepID=UPI00388D562D
MAITGKMWEVAQLLENIGEARFGKIEMSPEIDEESYVEDVRKRIPEMEKALLKLKRYMKDDE